MGCTKCCRAVAAERYCSPGRGNGTAHRGGRAGRRGAGSGEPGGERGCSKSGSDPLGCCRLRAAPFGTARLCSSLPFRPPPAAANEPRVPRLRVFLQRSSRCGCARLPLGRAPHRALPLAAPRVTQRAAANQRRESARGAGRGGARAGGSSSARGPGAARPRCPPGPAAAAAPLGSGSNGAGLGKSLTTDDERAPAGSRPLPRARGEATWRCPPGQQRSEHYGAFPSLFYAHAEEEGTHGETEAIAIQVTGETSSQHSPENQSGECPCCRKPGKSLAEQPCFFKARYSSVPSQGVTVIFSCLLLPPQRLSYSLSVAEPVPQEVASRKNLADVLAMREPLRDPDPSPGRGGEATWRCPPGQQRSGSRGKSGARINTTA
ncbi:serine/arginine repetitive matrix protein 3-like [Phaenicophaeus curvirostris]|uniref:serine/arginine repetitive matrix protein 3-like n=1 Tax=Phaenicophaeus curvirostris TaxID=33595 RepID=UPI0037F0E4F8